MAGNGADESNYNTVFIDTNLDTRVVVLASDSDTVSDLKRKIVLEHRSGYPDFGDINVHRLKVKRRGNFYPLSDSIPVKSAIFPSKKVWFISVEASRQEQDADIQHTDRREAGDQLALPWVTNSQSIDRNNNNHSERIFNLPSDCGSPSMHPIIAPFKNPKVPSTDQFDSCKDVSKNIGENRSTSDEFLKNPEPDSEKQLSTKDKEEVLTENKTKSKKRTRDVQNKSLLEDAAGSGPSVKKRRKSQKLEEGIVSKSDTSKLKDKATSLINENSCEPRSESKDVVNENTRGDPDQVATIVEEVQDETRSRKNTEPSEIVPEVVMAVEKNIEQEMVFGTSEMEKDTEFVQQAAVENEIPSAPVITGTGQESAADQIDKRKKGGEGKKRKSKKSAVKSKDESLVKDVDNIVGDISSTVPAPVFDEKTIDETKNDKDTISSAERNEVSEKTLIDDSFGCDPNKGDDIFVKEVDIFEPTEDVATVTNEEKLSPHVEGNENMEMAAVDVLPVDNDRNDDVMMNNDVEVLRTENNASQVNVEGVNGNSEKPNEKMDDGTKKIKTKKKAKKTAVKSDNVAVVTNEEILPQTEGNENMEITSIDALHTDHVGNDNILADNDVDLSRTEKNVSQVNAEGINDDLMQQNEKMDDGTKKNKTKKKSKKTAVKGDDVAVVANEEKLLPQTEGNENTEMTSINAMHIDQVENDNILTNNDVDLSKTEKNVTEINAEGINNDLEKIDDGTKKNKKKKAKKSAVRSDNVAVVANEEKLLPQTEGNENTEMTSINTLHIDHVGNDNILTNIDVDISRTEKNVSEVNDEGINDELVKQNEKIDDGTKKNKTKKKAKKSAGKSNNVAVVANELPQTEGNENIEMTSVDALNIDHVGNDNILLNNDVDISRTEDNVSRVNAESIDNDMEKQKEKIDDGTKNKKRKSRKSAVKSDKVAVVANEEKLLPPDDISKDNSHEINFKDYFVPRDQPENNIPTDIGKDAKLPGKKTGPSFVETSSNLQQSLVLHDNKQTGEQDDSRNDSAIQTQKSLSRKENSKALLSSKEVSEVSKDAVKDQNTGKTAEVKTPKRTTKTDTIRAAKTNTSEVSSNVVKDQNTRNTNETKNPKGTRTIDTIRAVKTKTSEVSNDVVKDQNTRNTDEFKTPKRTTKVDTVKATKTVQAGKKSSGPTPELSSMSESLNRSFPDKKSNQQKSTLGQSHLNISKKSEPVVKNLLNTPGALFGDDSDESTRTPSRMSSSSSEESDSASSIDTRKNVVKRKDAFEKSTMNSQSTEKKSLTEILKSSSSFKKARFSASQQQVNNTESQPVDFVPESQL